jgi:hypothetical protein
VWGTVEVDIRLDDQFLRHPKTLKLKKRQGAGACAQPAARLALGCGQSSFWSA